MSIIFINPYRFAPIHPEALNWANRVASNSGTVSSTTLQAVSSFCVAIDAEAGLRAAITRLNLFCGGNLNAALVPLYLAESFGAAAKGNTTDTNNNFTSSDYSETGTNGGLKGNGTSKFLNTGLQQNAFGTGTSLHLSVSGKEMNTGTGDSHFLGAYGNTSPGVDLHCFDEVANYVSGRAYRSGSFNTGQFPVTTRVSSETHLLGTRTSSTSSVIYRAGSSVASNSNTVTHTRQNVSFYIFAMNALGTAGGFSASRMRMYSIGSGITASQALAFSNAVSAFNTALNR